MSRGVAGAEPRVAAPDRPLPAPLAYRPDEAFRLIGVSRSAGWRLIRSGRLPSFLIGRIRLVSARALQEWLDTEEREQTA